MLHKIIQINTCLVALFLLYVGFGWYNGDFDFVRWYVFLSAIIITLPLFKSRDVFWITVFGVVAVIFNPFVSLLTLPRTAWQVVDILVAGVFVRFLYYYYDAYQKGLRFEQYIASLFPPDVWVIIDRTKDISKHVGRFVESDTYPDFTFKHIAQEQVIAVECKYHSYFSSGKYGDQGIWWNKKQGARYESYGKQNSIPVFIAVGLMGSPKKPKRLFLIPLEKLNTSTYSFITEQELKKYERKVGREFLRPNPLEE